MPKGIKLFESSRYEVFWLPSEWPLAGEFLNPYATKEWEIYEWGRQTGFKHAHIMAQGAFASLAFVDGGGVLHHDISAGLRVIAEGRVMR